MVHGQCLRTLDRPTATVISYTSPNVCSPHCPIQWPFPTSPSFSSVSFPCCPHPQPFLPFLRTFSICLSLINMWTSPLRCKASQSANTLYSSWPLLNTHNMTGAAATALPCQGAVCPLAQHGGTPGEHCDPTLGKATRPTSVLVHVSLEQRRGSSASWVQRRSWGKHRSETVWYFILSAIFSMPGFWLAHHHSQDFCRMYNHTQQRTNYFNSLLEMPLQEMSLALLPCNRCLKKHMPKELKPKLMASFHVAVE